MVKPIHYAYNLSDPNYYLSDIPGALSYGKTYVSLFFWYRVVCTLDRFYRSSSTDIVNFISLGCSLALDTQI